MKNYLDFSFMTNLNTLIDYRPFHQPKPFIPKSNSFYDVKTKEIKSKAPKKKGQERQRKKRREETTLASVSCSSAERRRGKERRRDERLKVIWGIQLLKIGIFEGR